MYIEESCENVRAPFMRDRHPDPRTRATRSQKREFLFLFPHTYNFHFIFKNVREHFRVSQRAREPLTGIYQHKYSNKIE